MSPGAYRWRSRRTCLILAKSDNLFVRPCQRILDFLTTISTLSTKKVGQNRSGSTLFRRGSSPDSVSATSGDPAGPTRLAVLINPSGSTNAASTKLIPLADGSQKALLPMSYIAKDDFDPSPIPQSVFDELGEQMSKWDSLKPRWRKPSEHRNCVYERAYKHVSVFENEEDFQCKPCMKHGHLCLVVIDTKTAELLPNGEKPDNGDVGEVDYWV